MSWPCQAWAVCGVVAAFGLAVRAGKGSSSTRRASRWSVCSFSWEKAGVELARCVGVDVWCCRVATEVDALVVPCKDAPRRLATGAKASSQIATAPTKNTMEYKKFECACLLTLCPSLGLSAKVHFKISTCVNHDQFFGAVSIPPALLQSCSFLLGMPTWC